MGRYVPMPVGLKAARKGQGLVEYMLILMLISTVAILVMGAFGMQVAQLFQVAIDSF